MVFSQAAHQVDIVRLLAGSQATSVRAFTGNWDAARNTEGAYNAQIKFADGSFASLTYSGYAHFDTDEFMGWWGELGQGRDGDASYGRARQNLSKGDQRGGRDRDEERRAPTVRPAATPFRPTANSRTIISALWSRAASAPICVRCRTASWSMATRRAISTNSPRRRYRARKSIDELYAAAISGTPPLHSGEWGLATLEICLAILESARTGQEVALRAQV